MRPRSSTAPWSVSSRQGDPPDHRVRGQISRGAPEQRPRIRDDDAARRPVADGARVNVLKARAGRTDGDDLLDGVSHEDAARFRPIDPQGSTGAGEELDSVDRSHRSGPARPADDVAAAHHVPARGCITRPDLLHRSGERDEEALRRGIGGEDRDRDAPGVVEVEPDRPIALGHDVFRAARIELNDLMLREQSAGVNPDNILTVRARGWPGIPRIAAAGTDEVDLIQRLRLGRIAPRDSAKAHVYVAAAEIVGLPQDRDVIAYILERDAEILLRDERPHLAGRQVDRPRLERPVRPAQHSDEDAAIAGRIEDLTPGDAAVSRRGRAVSDADDERSVG